MTQEFRQAIPWGIGGGRPYLRTTADAVTALDGRLGVSSLSPEEAQEVRALKRMLVTSRGDAGTLDLDVIAAAFSRFVGAWHKRNRNRS